jgi:hypothetical protein
MVTPGRIHGWIHGWDTWMDTRMGYMEGIHGWNTRMNYTDEIQGWNTRMEYLDGYTDGIHGCKGGHRIDHLFTRSPR